MTVRMNIYSGKVLFSIVPGWIASRPSYGEGQKALNSGSRRPNSTHKMIGITALSHRNKAQIGCHSYTDSTLYISVPVGTARVVVGWPGRAGSGVCPSQIFPA